MGVLHYSDAELNDLPEIVEIYNSTVASRMVTADSETVTVESRITWFEEHNNKRPLWVIKNDQQKIIGWVSFQDFYGRPAYSATAEISIYLTADQRGKGLGKEVLAYSIEESKKLGISNVIGYIFAHNERSLTLFKNAGFEQWGVLPNIAVLDGTERSLVIMGRRIQ